ncbi:MAG: septal ring lytic transglycosylase RlpA family protein [Deltaproteobacteria bacterium]
MVKHSSCSGYTVKGQTYHPMKEIPPGFRMEGVASWYGGKFHGRRTASGEVYDMHELTAAHKTLPLGTFVKVTNLENKREVVVRINDRGPFIDNRVIDLSFAAAKKLAMVRPGTAAVRVSVIGKGTAVLALRRPSSWDATSQLRAPNPFYTNRKSPRDAMKKI